MNYLNPVQAVIDRVLDLDVPDDQLADALAAQLADLGWDQAPEPTVDLH